MRDYSDFRRFAYIQYLTQWLSEHKDTMWDVLNKTAEKWSEVSQDMSFHAYVIAYGMETDKVHTFKDFLNHEYNDPKLAGEWFCMIKDMQIWADDHGIELPDDYRGL